MSTSDKVQCLEAENERLKEMILDLFRQACWSNDGKGKYDHYCISTYEDAQDFLIKEGLIKPEECNGK